MVRLGAVIVVVIVAVVIIVVVVVVVTAASLCSTTNCNVHKLIQRHRRPTNSQRTAHSDQQKNLSFCSDFNINSKR